MKRSSILALLMLAGCAADPSTIKPVDFDAARLSGKTCPEIFADYQETSAELDRLTIAQGQKRTGDTAGVLLLGLPISSMASEDIAPKIAELKGRKEALDTVISAKKCAVTPSSDGSSPAKPRRRS